MVKINQDKESALGQEQLKEMLEYNSTTGEFIWIERKQGRKFRQPAGRIKKSDGYREIGINGHLHLAHRLAWAYVYGDFPEGEQPFIDHINGKKDDNRIVNLKVSSAGENNKNKGMMSNNTSGVTGVRRREIVDSSGKIYPYWVANWYDKDGKQRQKSFEIERLGEDEAREMAIQYREKQISLLESEHDIIYSERHGKYTKL